jgi:hypothetical protein
VSSIRELNRDSRANRSGLAGATYAVLVCASISFVGCGRVGLELWPYDAGGIDEAEAGPDEEDSGVIDAGPEMDASLDDAAGDTGVSYVDGCVLTAQGTCATCNPANYERNFDCFKGCFDTASFCLNGIEIACTPGKKRADNDTTCDGQDDDCDGTYDEDYVPVASSCGIGVCANTAQLICAAGSVQDRCVPGMPKATRDDATGTGNGVDDDCDGSVDEDVSTCTDTMPRAYEAGVYSNIAAPTGCGSVTIQLWGGAGGAGGQAGISEVRPGGRSGSGGYARSTLSVTGPITLYVGSGAAAGCTTTNGVPGTPGMYAGAASIYSGGRGGRGLVGDGDGDPGNDKMVQGGGKGASNLLGHKGGDGYFGGGGGGAGLSEPVNDLIAAAGGGGGAASAVVMNGMRVMVAGGGGGGGAASSLVYAFGESGGNGGEGCSGSGTSGEGLRTGGGGGGGVCQGMVVSMGSNGVPANSGSVPPPRARGTNMECNAGGNGYAIVTFAR